jgi:4-amino-4-deoxy-L-arabinose transferase-like glycosyltransferase
MTERSPQQYNLAPAWRDILWLLLVLSIWFGAALGNRALWEPDEARYAEIAREMLATGDYVTPRLNGVKYFEKPVLFYWLQAGAIKAFGQSEWVLRLWPAFFALLGCLLVYATARRFYDQQTGLIAAAVLASNPLYYLQGRVVNLDMAVSVMLSAALLSFIAGVREAPGRARRLFFWAFYVCMGLAMLTKGLMGVVLPGLVIGVWIMLLGEWRQLKHFYLPSGIALFALVVLPWHVLVAQANPEFNNFYFIHEHFQRYLTTVHQRYEPAWFFIPVLVAGFFPWTGFLFQSIKHSWPHPWGVRHSQRENLFFILWAVLIFAFFSYSDSKLVPYILPTIPPLAILTGKYLSHMWSNQAPAGRTKGYWFVLSVGVLLGGAFIFAKYWLYDHPAVARYNSQMGHEIALFALLLVLMGMVPFMLAHYRRWRLALTALLLGSAASLVTMMLTLPKLDDVRSVKALTQVLKPLLRDGEEVMSYNVYNQGLPFYLSRRVTIVNWRGELAFGSQAEDVSAWMIDAQEFRQRWRGASRVYAIARQDAAQTLRDEGLVIHTLAERGRNTLLTNHEPTP